jgi:multiple sugar transport system ATP-binding protein
VARIELKNLRKEFGATIAVKELNLEIEDGEFLVLVGPSGCGKTTTLRMMAGFEDPTTGEITMDGAVVNDLEPRDRDIGMVFQNHALFPHKSVYDNIEFGLRMKKMAKEERRKIVHEVAEMVHITPLLDKMPAQCSGGESQRVALARTLVTEPSTFLLDEPLSSLDAKLRRELRAEVDRLHTSLKKTFIYVTHDQEEAMTLADRIVVMRAGVIEQEGTPMQIYSDPKSYFVADFFGSPSMNLTDGEIIAQDGKPVFKNGHMELPVPELYKGKVSGNVTLGIRPEHVVVEEKSGQVPDTIDLVEPMGKETLLYFEAGEERPFIVIVEGLADDELQSGQDVKLTFPEDKVFFFDKEGQRIR